MISQTSAERYAQAKKIFFAALELDAAKHAEFIRLRCGDDEELRREVESLLAVRRQARDFLESPAFGIVSDYKNLENKIIGGYRLIREIGEGGMGVVFLAEKNDPEFRRQVALKIVKSDVCSKKIFKRFNLERRILAQLEHPNIAHLIDGGKTSDGMPYLVMEYVEGVPLTEYAENHNLSLRKRLELFRQVCAAVSFAHRHAVIHRDLKPSNILVTADGQVKLLDFGVAKLLSADTLQSRETATTFRAMTPEFASPEQIKGEPVTTASDIYSLGIVLYKLLTGIHPYKTKGENWNEIVRAACEVEPTRPSSVVASKIKAQNLKTKESKKTRNSNPAIANPKLLRGDLDNIVLKALRKTPERRYSSVEQFSEDLRRHLEGLPVSARPNTLFYRTQKFVRRNRLPAALTALVILAMIGGIVAASWQAGRAERERARAERRFQDVRTLVNSFMFELNDEILKGQTQARELVVRRALEYLNRLAAEPRDDPSLRREIAVAYLKIGDIQGKPYSPNLGNTDGALESYEKALSILETLYDSYPENLEIKRNLAQAYSSIGSLQETRKRETKTAIQYLEKSRELLETLIAAEPKNLQNRRMLAEVYKLIGDVTKDTTENKIAAHQKALEILGELLLIEPTNVKGLTVAASCYQRIGTAYKNQAEVLSKKSVNDVQGAMNSYRIALNNFNKSLSIYHNLMTIEPSNSRHRRNAADIMAMSLPVQANLGDKAGVIKDYQGAIEIFGKLSADDPKNFEARLDIAFTQDYMCRSLVKLGSADQARQFCRKAVDSGNA
ncbi:MAG TPA: protein kinase, partial [Pyrinomonadaceae bacterium]|nr:protein kinase [Pyrinomonadaceae bacterium]